MLGSLSRWLRLLGYDAEYFRNALDKELLELTTRKGAVLLTRDLELFKRAKAQGLASFYVEGRDEAERLASVAVGLGLRLDFAPEISRCPTCNGELRGVRTEEVEDRVQPRTLKRYKEFWACNNCGKVYWRGGHWEKICRTLRKAKEISERLDQIEQSFQGDNYGKA
jgi:uncharacterized protein with PIN domain